MAAVTSQDKEFWFPPNDNVLLPENKKFNQSGTGTGSVSSGFSPVGSSWSGLSSPLGSELGSTEAESEEDDDVFMAELTRQMADYMLTDDDEESAFNESGTKKFKIHNEKNPTLIRNKVNKCKQGLVKGTGLVQQSEQKKPNGAQTRADGVLGPWPLMWPMLQPPQVNYGSVMRAVFLGGPTSKTKNSGTGVFLPRGSSTPSEVPKKKGSSTVLIPTRVLNALQLHFQNVNNRYQSDGLNSVKSYPPQYIADITSAQERNSETRAYSANMISDIGLPQEWTY